MNPVARCLSKDGFMDCRFDDVRLEQRLHRLVERIDRCVGASLAFAC